MKKLVRKLVGFAVCGLVAVSMTSCHHDDSNAAIVEKTVELTTSRTLIVYLDAALPSGATLTYNGSSNYSKSTESGLDKYTFNNVADSKKVVLQGGNVIAQESIVTFGEKSVVALNISVKVKSEGTEIKTNEGAEDDDDIDKQATSTVTLSKDAVDNNPSLAGKKLGVTMFAKLQNKQNEVKKGATIEVAPYTLDCEPDGAEFNPAVDVVTELPGASGCNIMMKGPNGEEPTQSFVGTTLTAKLTHFSPWDIFMFTDILDYIETTEEIGSGNLTTGTNTISYKENSGYTYNENEVQGSMFIIRCLNAMFGTPNVPAETKTSTIDASAAGTYTVYQNVETITLKSGTRVFTIEVWGSVSCTTKVSEGTIVKPTHNGGSND